MQADPGQENNLYGDPDYVEVIAELDRRLTEFFRAYSAAQLCRPAKCPIFGTLSPYTRSTSS